LTEALRERLQERIPDGSACTGLIGDR